MVTALQCFTVPAEGGTSGPSPNFPDTRMLLSDLDLGDARWPRLAEQLQRHCGGNPAFLLESVKAMITDAAGRKPRVGCQYRNRCTRPWRVNWSG